MKKGKLLLTILSLGTLVSISGCGENDLYKIGVLLPVTHDALNQAVEGFIEGLKEAGYKDGKNIEIVKKNAQGNSDDQTSMAKSLMDTCDMTLGLGTGASYDLKSAQVNKGSSNPILFTAVTDPVSAELVDSLENTTGYVTGTSDAAPINDQIALIKECKPDVDKIGIFYTITETNSEIQAIQAKEAINKLGNVTAITKTCTNSTDISTAITALCREDGLDAIYIPTDNNVAANMPYIKEAVANKNILVVAGEEGMLKEGGHITLSISYFELGRKCGQMGAQIIKGEKKPNELPVGLMSKDECNYVLNSENLLDAGITLPQSVIDKCTDINK